MPHTLKHPQPIAAMNVTPFIDVLLVLLIMLILAIPMSANVTPVDIGAADPPVRPVLESNALSIDANDRTLWNGYPVSTAELRDLLAAASELPVQPVLLFEPDARASYDKAARTIALIREEGAANFAFVGNEKYRDFP